MNTLRKIVSTITILELVMALMVPGVANAATLTSAKDELSTNKAGVVANHTIYFVTPTAIAATNKIVITMADFTVPAGISDNDVDIAEGSSGTCISASYTEKTIGGGLWSVASTGTTVTITSGTGTITSGRCVRIKIGSHAEQDVAGSDQIQNAAVGSRNIVITTKTAADAEIDTTTISVAMVTDPQVDLSADVGTSLTMTLSSTTADFATTLSTASTTTASTVVTINTNSGSGYALKYSATPLTNQTGTNNVLAALGSETAAAPNTEQWGLNAATTGMAGSGDTDGVTNTSYDESGKYMVITTSTATLLAIGSGMANAHTYTVTYGADIGALTPSGSYTGTVDFLVYGTF